MKAFLEWRDDWFLGIGLIDQQHLELVDLVNRIATSLEASQQPYANGSDAMDLVLKFQEETRRHFRDEEAFMLEHDYPARVSHHREHALLQAELRMLIREIEAGKRAFDLEILKSLKHWLIDHVIDSDRAIARYMERR
ncbi:MAG: bacteriohemerythrin [Candidatus Thiodiazotropha sp. (ex Dulcina madagascariensis)]|nr:bacteriohemerythrin [Candidatus Thiodiazotropha sp. (ex Dulcina madagascariensis)]MCU7927365.1 bacteriohemerythrin [Candidatus Thiodiazotropha sp. (ex Dulcina madagascariensis)]